jgi:cell division protein FtsB
MNKNYRKIIGIISIFIIIGLFSFKGINYNLSIEELIPIIFTTTFVTTFKFAIIYTCLLGTKQIVKMMRKERNIVYKESKNQKLEKEINKDVNNYKNNSNNYSLDKPLIRVRKK